ncbi:MAG: hypothetical protein IK151_04715 [Erysipelotrichaceae bacterium]|nr:hypothetical protein [Erysipelotrichaceae bacterium]
MKKKINLGGFIVLLVLIGLLVFFCQYLLCIPLNIQSFAFLLEFLLIIIAVYFYLSGLYLTAANTKKKGFGKSLLVLILLPLLLVVACLVGTPYTGGLGNYQNQSKINEADFEQIPQFDKTQVQLVDKNTAQQLGDRVFGTLGSDEVSQYAVGDDWVQISLNGSLYRVTPIDFGGLFKYFVTKSTPGYITVDCETGEAKLVKSEGLKYMKTAYFSHDLIRHVFFHDPTALLGSAKFELDDNREPYWVVPVYSVTWIGKTRDVKGVYIVDPRNGDMEYYDKNSVPSWVDNVYPVSTVYRQFSETKYYENGLFNWSKKGVVEFTDDYAYVQFNGNVYIYTGVTSVGKDESNVGFAYVNLRNGEITYIRRAGAEEYSARSSAEGALQQYHYTAIFPSMVNVKGVPTYFMGLVDGANLIKSYAFVSYENYQMVATGTTVEEAYNNYLKLIDQDGGNDDIPVEYSEKTFTVSEVRIIVKDGNSIVLLTDESDNLYWYDLSDGDYAASFIKEAYNIKAMVSADGRIKEFIKIDKAQEAVQEVE